MTTATSAVVLTNRQFFTIRWQAEYPAFVRVMEALSPDRLSYRPHPRSRSAGELMSVLVQEALAASALVDTSEYHWVEPPASQDLEQTLNAWRRHHTALAHRIANIDETAWLRTAREAVRVSCVTSRAARVRTRPLCHAAIASLNIDISLFCDTMPTAATRRRLGGPKIGPTNFQTLQIVRKSALSEVAPACLGRISCFRVLEHPNDFTCAF